MSTSQANSSLRHDAIDKPQFKNIRNFRSFATWARSKKISSRSKSIASKVDDAFEPAEDQASLSSNQPNRPYPGFRAEPQDATEDITGWDLDSFGADEESLDQLMGKALRIWLDKNKQKKNSERARSSRDNTERGGYTPTAVRQQHAAVSMFTNANNVRLRDTSINVYLQSSASSESPTGQLRFSGVVLMDAVGKEFTIPIEFAMSYETFDDAVRLLFRRNTMEARLQREYMEEGLYDFGVDEGQQVKILDDAANWSLVSPGTKITMRIILTQESTKDRRGQYKCPRPGCGVWNDRISDESSVDCKGCYGRFQISPGGQKLLDPRGTHSSERALLVLLRNIHLKAYEVHNFFSS
ncbi:hypothetical protein CPB83DRAFT_895821 [Crepidotus variabilis]|uniref:Ubiquitin-like domain-containing protein n=1 Tax=Crepidotus variabilis TaxID=179855 RepID=A0A9P6ECA7_9AGAR|nr:hypothetical protein CPB83DRAFT_895821 [Crepidotus variabilis]